MDSSVNWTLHFYPSLNSSVYVRAPKTAMKQIVYLDAQVSYSCLLQYLEVRFNKAVLACGVFAFVLFAVGTACKNRIKPSLFPSRAIRNSQYDGHTLAKLGQLSLEFLSACPVRAEQKIKFGLQTYLYQLRLHNVWPLVYCPRDRSRGDGGTYPQFSIRGWHARSFPTWWKINSSKNTRVFGWR